METVRKHFYHNQTFKKISSGLAYGKWSSKKRGERGGNVFEKIMIENLQNLTYMKNL